MVGGAPIDTLALAREKRPGKRNSLDALCRDYKVDASERQLHGALLDAELLTRVYLEMTREQSHMFGAQETSSARTHDESVSILNVEGRTPMVIQPSEAERACHQELLNTMRGQGEILWDQAP